jgi:hypothetical protein
VKGLKRAILLLITVLALISADGTVAAAKTRQLAGKVTLSATIRTNKRGLKVDLTKAHGYKDAVADFSHSRWGPCAEKLETLDRTGFCCDLVHYYIAQCYQNCNQLARAQQHYGWVTSYSKDAKLRVYANYASNNLDYYGAHRTYGGQGNNFDRQVAGSAGGGGGGGLG